MMRSWIVPAMLLLAAGCSGDEPTLDARDLSGRNVSNAVAAPDAVADERAPAPPTITSPPGSVAAAGETLRRYFWLIGEGDHAGAYALWQGGAAGMSSTAFAQSFAKYASYDAVIGQPGRLDSGAGNVYIEIPVRVSGTLKTGEPFTLEGPIRLHRVNDVPGSSEADRSWHIAASGLRPRPIQQGKQ